MIQMSKPIIKVVVEEKPFYKSKTFWVGVLQVVIGVLTYIQDQLGIGASLTISGILMVALRLITKQPVSIKRKKR